MISIKNLGKVISLAALHKYLKKKAVEAAVAKVEKEKSIDNQFYISIPASRSWIDLETRWEDQNLVVSIMKIKNYLSNFGGDDLKVADSNEESRIYFSMPRTSVEPMFKDLKKHFPKISLGEVKLKNY